MSDENGDRSATLKKTETLPKEPELIATIKTAYKKLHSVTCLSEEKFWTNAKIGDMKCFNVQGNVIKTVKQNQGNGQVISH
jgi:hypothetical protein